MFVFLIACSPDVPPPSEPPPTADAVPIGTIPGTTAGDTGPTEPTEPTESEEDPRDLPVLFIHGINGDASNWDEIVGHLTDDGWPPEQLFAQTFDDPEWGCNIDNASTIDTWVQAILEETGADRINLVAHSMGTLSSRYFVKNLGGSDIINTYATLGGMHHGLASSCSPDFPFKPCVWEEICSNGDFVQQLNDDPSTPGELYWVSIYGTADTTVPSSSSQLDGAENIVLEGVEHDGDNGLQSDLATYEELVRVLSYPRW